MKLYYCDTLAPRKVCAFARHVAAPVEFIHVRLEKGEHKMPGYLTLNPNGKVPTLVHGEKVLWEADAILCELAEAAAPDYLPDADQQIELIKWFSWNSQHFIRAGGALYFEHIIRPRFGMGQPDQAEVTDSLKNFRKYARVLDDHLDGRRWLMGDRLSLADFSVGICLPYAQEAQLPIDDFPNMKRWHDRLSELDGWTDPWPAKRAQ